MTWRIALSELAYGAAERAAVLRVMESEWLSGGPEVAAFESELATATDSASVVAVSSATAALHLAFIALGIGPGDEVIQPAVNFVACANMTRAVGATPVFADVISLEDPTMDPSRVSAAVTSRTRCIVAMHYGGTPARVGDLLGISNEAGAVLVEDACHALGSTYGEAWPGHESSRIGSAGAMAAFSFFSNKNVATGEGGALSCTSDKMAGRVRLLKSHGMTTASWDRFRGHASSYDVKEPGFNYRLDDLHAALGRAQLNALAENNAHRMTLWRHYRDRLSSLPGWTLVHGSDSRPNAGHLCVVVAPSEAGRHAAAEALAQAGIQTSRHYPCVTDFMAHDRGQTPGDVALSREFAHRTLTLPLHPRLTVEQVDEIAATLRASAAT